MTTAVVTGASGGVGGSLTKALLQSGFEVVGIDRNPASGLDSRLQYTHLAADLTDLTTLTRVAADLPEDTGLLVHAAAVQHLTSAGTGAIDDWLDSFKVNTLAVEVLTAGVRKSLTQNPPHAVVCIGSVHEILTSGNIAPYSVTKAASAAWVRAAAIDLAPTIHVVNLALGATNTSMLKAGLSRSVSRSTALAVLEKSLLPGRLLEPRQVAEFIMQLLKLPLDHLSGATVRLDGGASSRLPGE